MASSVYSIQLSKPLPDSHFGSLKHNPTVNQFWLTFFRGGQRMNFDIDRMHTVERFDVAHQFAYGRGDFQSRLAKLFDRKRNSVVLG